ncbi:MAG: hypothetical protein K2M95_00750 [Clostridiales bacterium]|nr:hypothetical protein [Clostridiales bacterium]
MEKPNEKSKKIIIISSISAAIVLVAIVFLVLGLTVWSKKEKPKTTAEWLNDFSASLAFDKDNANQKFEKRILITESEIVVADYYALVEVHAQEQGVVGHIQIIEKYPSLDTEEFDTHDEYYFINDRMYMRRESNGESVQTSFASTWETFWAIPDDMFGKYAFEEGNFSAIRIERADDHTALHAEIGEETKRAFFKDNTNADKISDATIDMEVDSALALKRFALHYSLKDTQTVSNIITRGVAETIQIKEFVGLA